MSAAWPVSPFWDFSLEIYGRPGVEAACLALQDEHHLDVNLVLLAAWLAASGRRLPPSLAARLRRLGEDYQARIMQPLREARRALRVSAVDTDLDRLRAACRQSLLRAELDLERFEQVQLEILAEGAEHDPASAPRLLLSANLAALYPALDPDGAFPSDHLAVLAAQLADAAPPVSPDKPSP